MPSSTPNEVVRHLGRHKRRAYAVQLRPHELDVRYWEQKNVQVIDADATEFLEEIEHRSLDYLRVDTRTGLWYTGT